MKKATKGYLRPLQVARTLSTHFTSISCQIVWLNSQGLKANRLLEQVCVLSPTHLSLCHAGVLIEADGGFIHWCCIWLFLTELSLLCCPISCPTIPQKGPPIPNANIFSCHSVNGDSLFWPSFCCADVARCSYTWKWSRCFWSLSPGPSVLHWPELCADQLKECVRRKRSNVYVFGDWESTNAL